jgi:hypothetical protein
MFTRGSRYEAIKDAEFVDRNGRTIRFKRMRFVVPPIAPLAMLVRAGERPDHLAHRAFGDSEQFWRLADANLIERPVDLAVLGRRLRVPGPGA